MGSGNTVKTNLSGDLPRSKKKLSTFLAGKKFQWTHKDLVKILYKLTLIGTKEIIKLSSIIMRLKFKNRLTIL